MNRLVTAESLITNGVTPLPDSLDPVRELVPGSEMHPTVFKAMALIYVAILAAFWVAFQASALTVFALGVCLVYLIMYFAAPAALVNAAKRRAGGEKQTKDTFGEFLDAPLSTWTGPCSGRVATIQMLLVPVALALAAAGMAIVVMITRTGI